MNFNKEYTYTGSSKTKLDVSVSTVSTNITTNTSIEKVVVKFIHTTSSWNSTAYPATLYFNGVKRTKTFSYNGPTTLTLFNFTQEVSHNANGAKTVNLKIDDNRHNMEQGYTGVVSVDEDLVLDTIPRYAVITSYTIPTVTFNGATVNWTTNDVIDKIQYRIGGQPWQDTSGSGTSGSFSFTGLVVNSSYTIYIQVRRADSGLWQVSEGIKITTKEIARFTSIPDNIDISKPFTVQFNRNDATTVEVGIYGTDGITPFAQYVTVIGSSHTFDLTKKISPSDTRTPAERMYDDMPTVEGKYYSVYIATNSNAYREAHNRTFLIRDAYPSQPIFEYEDIDEDTLELTGSKLIFIQNYSKLKLKITASTAFRGATIKKYIVSNGYKTKEYTSAGTKNDFGVIVAQQLQVTAVDSRGFLSTNIIQLNYKEYTQPLIQNLSIERVIGTGTTAKLVTDGLYLNINFGAVVNKIKKVEYRRKSTGDYGIWHDITTLVLYGSGTFNNAAISNITGFTFGTEYTCEIRVTDELSFATRTTIVSKGMFTALIDKEYGSVGIGEIPKQEENSLIVKGNIYAPNIITYEIISDI